MNFKICILFFIALASPASSIEDDEEVTLKLLTSYNVDYNSAIKECVDNERNNFKIISLASTLE